MRIAGHECSTRTAAMLLFSCLLASWTILEPPASAQQQLDRGQNVQPAYEGWERNADGSYNLIFGYMNRNFVEEVDVPIGTSNSFSPGPPDQGQPTHFYPRRQLHVFKVRVPADWGSKELTWAVTHAGRTDRAIGWLGGFYELDGMVLRARRGGGLGLTDTEKGNKAPSIARVDSETVTTSVATPVTLAVTASDDGIPGPAKVSRPSPERARRFAPAQDKVNLYEAAQTGLAVTWLHYRGPGMLTFEPMVVHVEKMAGRATTRVQFSEPGTYVVRAVADDRIFTVPVNFTVNVQPSATR